MNEVLIPIFAFLSGLFIKDYFPTYFRKKAENLATKEDIADITQKVEEVKTEYLIKIEHVKAELKESEKQTEHFHQISQSTYQKLFEKKIEVYQMLINENIKYENENSKANIEFHTEYGAIDGDFYPYYSYFIRVQNIVKKYRLYISNKLSDYFNEIPSSSLFNIDMGENNQDGSAMQEGYMKLYKESNKAFEKFWEQLNEDIKIIRKKIDL